MNGAIKSCMKEANDDENPKSQIEKRNLILHKPHTLTEKYFDNLWWEKYTTDQSVIKCDSVLFVGPTFPSLYWTNTQTFWDYGSWSNGSFIMVLWLFCQWVGWSCTSIALLTSPSRHLPSSPAPQLPETSPGRDLQSEMDPSNERKDKGVHFIDTVFFV